MVKTKLN